jgi:hypothetical protein
VTDLSQQQIDLIFLSCSNALCSCPVLVQQCPVLVQQCPVLVQQCPVLVPCALLHVLTSPAAMQCSAAMEKPLMAKCWNFQRIGLSNKASHIVSHTAVNSSQYGMHQSSPL